MAGNVYMGAKRLPSGYTRVEYIESSGTQYIDTGFKPSGDTRLVLSGYNTSSDSVWIAGSWNSASTCTYTVRFPVEFYFGGNTTKLGLGTILGTFEIDFNKNVVSVNGTSTTMPSWSFTGSYNMYLFALNAAGNVSSGRFIGKIYSCKIYDNGTLVRDFVPCYRDSDRVVGLYDAVHWKFYTNAGTGTFTCPLPPMELPQGYTQVEYIKSSGIQYIDTGFKPNQDTRIVTDTVFTMEGAPKRLYGARERSMSKAFCFTASSGGYYLVEYGTAQKSFSSSANSSTKFTIDHNKNTVTLNGEHTVTCATETFTAPCNLFLFGMNENGSVTGYAATIYACRIYDNGTLIRDYVPCINANGVAGLYDMANGLFYRNSGTGSFTVGETYKALETESVARKAKNIYIGINGVARKVKKSYFGDENGIAQEWFEYSTVGKLAVGSSVFMNVNGARIEFLVVHQGIPDATLYDESCNGTWLLIKPIIAKKAFNTSQYGDYTESAIHSYLNDTYINYLDEDIRSIIKQVKIPYVNSSYVGQTGANGLSTKLFSLSVFEVYQITDLGYTDGAILDYFKDAQSSKCIAKYGSTATVWWLRTPYLASYSTPFVVSQNGARAQSNYSNSYGVRPALILPSETLVDDDFNVTA